MIICLAANPSVDVLYEVPELRLGQIHRPSRVVRTAGGKALNVARAIRAVDDVEVEALAMLGGSSGDWIAEELLRLGIDLHIVETSSSTRSCISVVDAAGLTEFYEPGLTYEATAWREMSSLLLDRASPEAWISISGSLPTDTPEEAAAELVTASRRGGCRIAVDISSPWLRPVLDTEPDLVKVNLAEARAALAGDDDDHPRKLLGRLSQTGRITVLTCGIDGAVMSDGRQSWRTELPELGRYPVGSGDAMLAGLLVAATLEASPPEALRLGTAAAVANAKQPGAGDLDADEVKRLQSRIEVLPW